MNPNILQTPIDYLKGVGPNRADLLRREIGIHTYQDLLNFFPNRYLDRTRFYKINELQRNSAEVQVVGKIVHMRTVEQKHGKRLVADFMDDTGKMELVWFRGQKWVRDSLKLNTPYVIFGKTTWFNGSFSMPHPELELVEDYKANLTSAMQPIYPSTEKLAKSGITNRVITKLMQQVFLESGGKFYDTLPLDLLSELRLLPKADSVFNIHFPKDQELLTKAQFRLKFEEFFYLQLQLLMRNLLQKQKIKGFTFEQVGQHFTEFYEKHLPFELTGAQKRVVKEIRQDMGSGAQMNRLLQGDVGSGKTIVALMTALLALDNGFQACLMAPTEILATQHYEGLKEYAAQMGLKIALLTGSVKQSSRKVIHQDLLSGDLLVWRQGSWQPLDADGSAGSRPAPA